MTQEDKNLLLKDISARLPYGVKVSIRDWDYPPVIQAVYSDLDILVKDIYRYSLLFECKPYLRPMSSMTEEEKRSRPERTSLDGYMYPDEAGDYVDWLNAHHFDYRGLIEEGLALVAPEGMYSEQ